MFRVILTALPQRRCIQEPKSARAKRRRLRGIGEHNVAHLVVCLSLGIVT